MQKSAFERHRATPLGVEELAGSEDDLMGRCLKCGKDNVKVGGARPGVEDLLLTCAVCSAAGNRPV